MVAGNKKCVCGKVINQQHMVVAAYGVWCCPDRIVNRGPSAEWWAEHDAHRFDDERETEVSE